MKYLAFLYTAIIFSSGCLLSLRSVAQVENHPLKEKCDTISMEKILEMRKQNMPSTPTKKSGVRGDQPNILVVMLDDARYDSWSANGGPAFFPTPNVDRIANEGVNIKNFFCVLPLCSPSRTTFYTGMYPHKHHVVNNYLNIGRSIPWISQILQSGGYYTALAGKLAFKPDSVRGFDDYMIAVLESYDPTKYAIWMGNTAIEVVVPGHTTDLLTAYVIGLLKIRPPDQPFFIYLAHRAPHVPYIPRQQDANLFADDVMPYKNAHKYTKNFPIYYYPFNEAPDSVVQDSEYRGYFRMLAGVEATFGEILHYMDSTNIMDNTLIIFTSDNGALKSEHLLEGKQLPQEESIRVPIFIRYPAWFDTTGEDIYDVMGCNIDWAPTLLDAAGIPDTFGMDGVSLRALVKHEVHRDAFMYEVWSENYTPSIRAVRTPYFKYTNSYCADTTEQLFDLVNDSLENTNLINDPKYQMVAQYYRCKLDSFRRVLKDSSIFTSFTPGNMDTLISDTIISCKLKNADSSHVGASDNPGPIGTCTFPVFDSDTTFNPVGIDDQVSADHLWDITVYNLYGEEIARLKRYYPALPGNQLVLNELLAPGLYIVEYSNKNIRLVRKVISQ